MIFAAVTRVQKKHAAEVQAAGSVYFEVIIQRYY